MRVAEVCSDERIRCINIQDTNMKKPGNDVTLGSALHTNLMLFLEVRNKEET